jgi:hypothetical protein
MRSRRLPIPARDAGQTVRNILNLHIQRGWIEQIEPPAR